MLLCVLTVSAQQRVNIRMSDGSVSSFFVYDVQQIFFDFYYEPRPENITVVDLGLPSGIKWSSVNYHKKGQEDVQNPLFPYKSTDVVAEDWGVRFGEPWRMATQADFQELLDNCNWTFDEEKACFYVTSTNEAIKDTLCLPYTGKDEGVGATNTRNGYYWMFGSQTGDKAGYFRFYSYESSFEHKFDIDFDNVGMAIRPVWDEHQEIVEVSAALGSKNSTLFTVSVSLNNPDGLEIAEYGIEYRASGDASWTAIPLSTAMSYTFTGLAPDTDYQFRGYAKTANNTFYSEAGSVHTDANTLLLSASHTDADIKYSSASVNVTFDAADLSAYNILEWGLYLSTKKEEVEQHLSSARKTATVAAVKDNIYKLSGLSEDTTYYYVACANVAGIGMIYSSPVMSFKTGRKPEFPVPDYVDLGLSVKWATFNVGASNDEEIGGYYGWGDPMGKVRSNSVTDYVHGLVGPADLSKAPCDTLDIAHVKYGTYWHTPTLEQFRELYDNTKHERVQEYGSNKISGYKFISKKDSTKYIFIPSCGYVSSWDENNKKPAVIEKENIELCYWTSEMDAANRIIAVHLNPSTWNKDGIKVYSVCHGLSIRAVYDDGIVTPEPTPTPTVDPMDIKTTLADGSIVPAAAVDLGLKRTMWATWNLGAKKKTGDVGGYYSWGETETKDDYLINTYTFHDKDKTYRQINNGKGILEAVDDAATQLWGEDWVMPTEDDWIELYEKTETKWETVGGIPGYRFTSTVPGYEDKSIFIPASGQAVGTDVWYNGEYGFYWSSSAFPSDAAADLATCMIFNNLDDENNIKIAPSGYITRFYGLCIRPVIPKTGYERKNAPLMHPRKLDRNKYRMFLPYNQ